MTKDKLFNSFQELLVLERKILRDHLPLDRQGDYIYALINFVANHNRMPQNRPLINDQLFRIRTTDEILDPLRVSTSDKELAKEYVERTVGLDHVVPTIAVLRTDDDIRQFDFPDDCVIKPTHGSGNVIRRSNGSAIDATRLADIRRIDFYRNTREANYRDLEKKLIVEPVVFGNGYPRDFKIFCVGGRPRLIIVNTNRETALLVNFFDLDWNPLTIAWGYPTNPAVSRPKALDRMLEIAAALSEPFDLVRVDLYSDGDEVFVGELTHCSGAANRPFVTFDDEVRFSQVLFGETYPST